MDDVKDLIGLNVRDHLVIKDKATGKILVNKSDTIGIMNNGKSDLSREKSE